MREEFRLVRKATMNFCIRCGTKFSGRDAKFCESCGAARPTPTETRNSESRETQSVSNPTAPVSPATPSRRLAPGAGATRPRPEHKPHMAVFAGGLALALAAIVALAALVAANSQAKVLDARLTNALPGIDMTVYCMNVRDQQIAPGTWNYLATQTGMSNVEVEHEIYDYCGMDIPANDRGLQVFGAPPKAEATPDPASTPSESASPVVTTESELRQIACNSTIPNSSGIRLGDRSTSVAALQWGLAMLKYETSNGSGQMIAIDGSFGPQTESAVIRFQDNHGLPSTGSVDQSTWQQLNNQLRTWGNNPPC